MEKMTFTEQHELFNEAYELVKPKVIQRLINRYNELVKLLKSEFRMDFRNEMDNIEINFIKLTETTIHEYKKLYCK